LLLASRLISLKQCPPKLSQEEPQRRRAETTASACASLSSAPSQHVAAILHADSRRPPVRPGQRRPLAAPARQLRRDRPSRCVTAVNAVRVVSYSGRVQRIFSGKPGHARAAHHRFHRDRSKQGRQNQQRRKPDNGQQIWPAPRSFSAEGLVVAARRSRPPASYTTPLRGRLTINRADHHSTCSGL
jgi:hypothetical protein